MERMSEHTGRISSYQLLITAAFTNTGSRMKGSRPEQLVGAHLYLDISKSGYLFHGISGGMYAGETKTSKMCFGVWFMLLVAQSPM